MASASARLRQPTGLRQPAQMHKTGRCECDITFSPVKNMPNAMHAFVNVLFDLMQLFSSLCQCGMNYIYSSAYLHVPFSQVCRFCKFLEFLELDIYKLYKVVA